MLNSWTDIPNSCICFPINLYKSWETKLYQFYTDSTNRKVCIILKWSNGVNQKLRALKKLSFLVVDYAAYAL